MCSVRCLLVLCNICLWLTGVTLILVGAIILSTGVLSDANPAPYNLIIFIIVLGFFIFLVGLYGCFGAVSGNRCRLKAFIICLAIIFLAEVTAGIFAFNFVSKATENGGSVLDHAIKNYDLSKAWESFMDNLQSRYQCCGRNGAKDYQDNRVPGSCCDKLSSESCFDGDHVYERGCESDLQDVIRGSLQLGGGLMIALAFYHLFMILFACCYIRYMKPRYPRSEALRQNERL